MNRFIPARARATGRPPGDPAPLTTTQGEYLHGRVWVLLISFVILALGLHGSGDLPGATLGIGLLVTGLLLVTSIGIIFAGEGHTRGLRITRLTAALDVTLISALLAYLGDSRTPGSAVAGPVPFELYFLVLAATSLTSDVRLSAWTGALAIIEYGAVMLWAVPGVQTPALVARLLLLAGTTLLASAVVARAVRLRHLATNDHLTGLHNRRYFDDHLHMETLRAWRYRRWFSVALLDVDHFKKFNDTYGHAFGDEALRSVARALREVFRASDLVARYGGEEFVVLMPETGHAEAVAKVDEARAHIARLAFAMPTGASARPVTLSAGVATAPEDGANAVLLLQAADARMFLAKQAGRDRTVGAGRSDAPSPPPAGPLRHSPTLGTRPPTPTDASIRSGTLPELDETMLTESQCALIRSNWAVLAPRAGDAARLFYDLLFERHPEVQPLFAKTDMDRLRSKYVDTLSFVVRSIDQVDDLIRVLEPLGRSHLGYGALPEHYGPVREVMLETLHRSLGRDFTDEARRAWLAALEFISGVMLHAGERA